MLSPRSQSSLEVISYDDEGSYDEAFENFSTDNCEKAFDGAVRRHFDPFTYGPEALARAQYIDLFPVSADLPSATVSSPGPTKARRMVGRARYRHLEFFKDGTVRHVIYDPPKPVLRIADKASAMDRVLDIFEDIRSSSHGSALQAALLQDVSTISLLQKRRDVLERFFATQTQISMDIMDKVFRNVPIRLEPGELESPYLCSKRHGTEGGVYLGLCINASRVVLGVYVGRTVSLHGRAQDHEIDLAVQMQTHKSDLQIEKLFYQRAACNIREGGSLLFFSANIIPIISQGKFSGFVCTHNY